jgi:hypothetical protein
VAALYLDFNHWPQLFPATIRGVRLVKSEPPRTTLEIDHREGLVPNVLMEVSPERVDLWESKRLYNATFINRFEPVPDGTRYTVSADIALKGAARVLGPLIRGYIRRQIHRYVLEPVCRAAEGNAA